MELSDEEKALKTRMQLILALNKQSMAKFAGNGDTARVKYSNQINRGGKVPYDTIVKFLRQFPDISTEWLILGVGDMLKTKQTSVSQSNVVNGSNSGNISNVNGVSVEDFLKIFTKK